MMLEDCNQRKDYEEIQISNDSSDDDCLPLKVNDRISSPTEKPSIFSVTNEVVMQANFAQAKFVGKFEINLENIGFLGPHVFESG